MSRTKIDEDCQRISHEEVCDMALKHYNEISYHAMHSNSLIPKAIKFYKDHYNSSEDTKNSLKVGSKED